MKILTLATGHVRYVQPFPALARVLGAGLLAGAPLMWLGAAAPGVHGGPAVALALAGLLDLLPGMALFGGARCIEADRPRRRLVVSHRAFGVALPFATRIWPLEAGARLVVSPADARGHHDVAFTLDARRQPLLGFATLDSARGFARAVAAVLQIDVDAPPAP